jgi:Family of unknown function (DUF6499)
MPRRRDWRSASAVETLNRLDRGGFAWEFLRRNPGYRREYNQISKEAASAAANREAVGLRWGLCFRLRSQACIGRRSGRLATGAGSSQRDPGLGTD